MRRSVATLAAAFLVAACGGSGGGAGGNHDMAMMASGTIPDPGASDQVENDFTSVEPNDTPAQATPLGTAKSGDLHVWVSGNNVTGGDAIDYFVFKSAPTPGQFTFDICGGSSITAMTATLWKVANQQAVMPPVHTWTSNGSCVMSAQTGDAPLVADTEYLFEVTATGTGSYSA